MPLMVWNFKCNDLLAKQWGGAIGGFSITNRLLLGGGGCRLRNKNLAGGVDEEMT